MSDDYSLDDFSGDQPSKYDSRPRQFLTPNAEQVKADDGKMVGYVERDRERGVAFCTHRHSERHYFEIYSGYAISLSVLAQAQAHGADYVFVWVKDQKRTYVFLLDHYLDGTVVKDEFTPEGDTQHVVEVGEAREVWNDQARPDIDIRTTGSYDGW